METIDQEQPPNRRLRRSSCDVRVNGGRARTPKSQSADSLRLLRNLEGARCLKFSGTDRLVTERTHGGVFGCLPLAQLCNSIGAVVTWMNPDEGLLTRTNGALRIRECLGPEAVVVQGVR